uniref:MARVEL domain-containing protein n=1 Tax=Oncorhynchus kisutch TaxID=8019 RepID=A0A8C7IN89_ONCKI
MVVFSCIVNEGYMNIGSERLLCVFNKNADACNYGVTVGVVCFLGSVCFLVLDIYFPTIHSVRLRRRATLIDMVFSALASFLWFVGFCFLANQWQQTTEEELPLAQGSDAARAAVAFCFFSILTWVRDTWGGGSGCVHFDTLFSHEQILINNDGLPWAKPGRRWVPKPAGFPNPDDASLWNSQSRPDVIQPGIEPGTVVTPVVY